MKKLELIFAILPFACFGQTKVISNYTTIPPISGDLFLIQRGNTYYSVDFTSLKAAITDINVVTNNFSLALILQSNVTAKGFVASQGYGYVGKISTGQVTNESNSRISYMSDVQASTGRTNLHYQVYDYIGFRNNDKAHWDSASPLGWMSEIVNDGGLLYVRTALGDGSYATTNNISTPTQPANNNLTNWSQLPTNVVNGLVPNQVTIATLPVTPTLGQQVFVSDVFTPRGVGDLCIYNGTNWLTRDNIIAVNDLQSYFLNCYKASLWIMTPMTKCISEPDMWTVYIPGIGSTSGGTGAGVGGYSFTDSGGSSMSLSSGTTTTGYSSLFGAWQGCASSFRTVGTGLKIYFSAVCDDTDKYWAITGFADTVISNPNTGAYFIYDMWNALGHGLTGTATNNWICVNANSSSKTYADSGLPAGVTVNSLFVITANGTSYFYTNGVLCQSISANWPQANFYSPVNSIVKTAGTTSRQMNISQFNMHIRHQYRGL